MRAIFVLLVVYVGYRVVKAAAVCELKKFYAKVLK